MPSSKQILSDLRVVMETGHKLELMNTYKGVPFVCEAQVVRIDNDLVEIEAHGPSLVCLINERQTKVLGSDYFEPSIAKVVSVDLPAGKVVLNNFAYLGTRLGERMIVRVEPEKTAPVWLACENQEIECELADLSMSGIGVRFPITEYRPIFKPGANLKVRIELPKTAIQATGTILSATRQGEIYRLSIRFAADHVYKLAIFHYLTDRRSQIEDELRQEYERALYGHS